MKKKKKLILELDYGTIAVKNLICTWIQPRTMQPGYMLCYKDDIYKRGIVYNSTNKQLLIKLQSKMMYAYAKGKGRVRL